MCQLMFCPQLAVWFFIRRNLPYEVPPLYRGNLNPVTVGIYRPIHSLVVMSMEWPYQAQSSRVPHGLIQLLPSLPFPFPP